ncbi:MAG: YitT family protein [Lachnospiraceae bacterium]|nr:YitT family protein [Lachnospiraceae bacterium]
MKNQMKTIMAVIVGNLIYALAVQIFLVPSNIVTAGATGLGLIVQNLLHIKLSTAVLGINSVLLLLGLVCLGKEFAINSLVGSLSYPILLAIVERVCGNVVLTTDPLLCTLFLGIAVGISLAIIIRAGASSGGMDIPPIILNRLFHIPMSYSMYAFDGLIVICLTKFYDTESILYGIILVMIYTMALEKFLVFGTTRVEIKIISRKSREIKDAILNKVDRGVTLLEAKGGFEENPCEMIFTVVSSRELSKVEKIIKEVDPTCFLTVCQITEVKGRGFTIDKRINEK